MIIFLPCSQGSASSAKGTRVVFPAPGSAIRTAEEWSLNSSLSCGKTSVIGNSCMISSPSFSDDTDPFVYVHYSKQ
ncbi:hypothetical protein D3C76_1462850 [compost metagenome]